MSACAMYDIIMCIILALILVQNVLQIYSEVACDISSNTNLSAWNRYETSVVSSNSPTVSNSKIPTVSFHSTPHACIQGDRGAITFGSDGLVYVTTCTTCTDPGKFDRPCGICVDNDGLVDYSNRRVQVF